MYYSPSQVSEMLGIPGSTLRHYAKLFGEYLSPQGGRKQRLYTEKDLLLFAQIKDLSAANIPLDQIGPRLVIDSQQIAKPQDSALALIPSVAAEIETANSAARAALARLEEYQRQTGTKLDELSGQLEQQAAELELYRKYLSLPWWKRLFYRPPTR